MDEIDVVREQWSLSGEQMVIGGLIIQGTAQDATGFWQVAQVLREQDFYSAKHRLLFRAIAALAERGIAADVFTLCDALQRRGQLDAAGGGDYVALLGVNTPSAANLLAYASVVREWSLKRKLAKAAVEAQGIARAEGPACAEERIAASIDRVFEVAQAARFGGGGADLDMPAMLNLLVGHLDAMQKVRARQGIIGVPTGIKALDDATGGMVSGDLIIMGGRPGMGKTAAALSIAYHAAKQGFRVGLVSTEMSGAQVIQRLAALDSGVPAVRMRDADLTQMEWQMLSDGCVRMKGLPLRVYDKPTCTLADIHVQARMWQVNGGLDLVLVDYLQRLKSVEKVERRDLEVGNFAVGLKTLARELNIPVVGLAQLRREVVNRADKRPNMADLRESGGLEQEADAVWLLHRPAFYDENAEINEAEIIIDKNRHGPCEIIRARWEPETMRWTGRGEYAYADAREAA